LDFSIRTHFVALLLLALLAFGIERWIVTDAEAIEALGEEAAAALRERDPEALKGLLDEDFHFDRRDRSATLTQVRRLLERYQPTGIQIRLGKIKVDGDRAHALGQIQGQASGYRSGYQVEVELIRGEEGWKLLEVTSR